MSTLTGVARDSGCDMFQSAHVVSGGILIVNHSQSATVVLGGTFVTHIMIGIAVSAIVRFLDWFQDFV